MTVESLRVELVSIELLGRDLLALVVEFAAATPADAAAIAGACRALAEAVAAAPLGVCIAHRLSPESRWVGLARRRAPSIRLSRTNVTDGHVAAAISPATRSVELHKCFRLTGRGVLAAAAAAGGALVSLLLSDVSLKAPDALPRVPTLVRPRVRCV